MGKPRHGASDDSHNSAHTQSNEHGQQPGEKENTDGHQELPGSGLNCRRETRRSNDGITNMVFEQTGVVVAVGVHAWNGTCGSTLIISVQGRVSGCDGGVTRCVAASETNGTVRPGVCS